MSTITLLTCITGTGTERELAALDDDRIREPGVFEPVDHLVDHIDAHLGFDGFMSSLPSAVRAVAFCVPTTRTAWVAPTG
jgi:hypothetical protein